LISIYGGMVFKAWRTLFQSHLFLAWALLARSLKESNTRKYFRQGLGFGAEAHAGKKLETIP
jgi:hypothetical protein